MNDEQCRGTTKSGTRCRIRVGLENGYCSRHKDQAGGKPSEKTAVNVPGEQAFPEQPFSDSEPARENTTPVANDESGHGSPCECECQCGGTRIRGLFPVTVLVGVLIAILWRLLRRRSG